MTFHFTDHVTPRLGTHDANGCWRAFSNDRLSELALAADFSACAWIPRTSPGGSPKVSFHSGRAWEVLGDTAAKHIHAHEWTWSGKTPTVHLLCGIKVRSALYKHRVVPPGEGVGGIEKRQKQNSFPQWQQQLLFFLILNVRALLPTINICQKLSAGRLNFLPQCFCDCRRLLICTAHSANYCLFSARLQWDELKFRRQRQRGQHGCSLARKMFGSCQTFSHVFPQTCYVT